MNVFFFFYILVEDILDKKSSFITARILLGTCRVAPVEQFIWMLPNSTTSKSDVSWHGTSAWGALSLNTNQLVYGKMLIIPDGVKEERRYVCVKLLAAIGLYRITSVLQREFIFNWILPCGKCYRSLVLPCGKCYRSSK